MRRKLTTAVEFSEHLTKVWNTHDVFADYWSDLEDTLVDVLSSRQLTDAEKIEFAKEVIDAYTLRKHFGYSKREMA